MHLIDQLYVYLSIYYIKRLVSVSIYSLLKLSYY